MNRNLEICGTLLSTAIYVQGEYQKRGERTEKNLKELMAINLPTLSLNLCRKKLHKLQVG